LTDGTYFTRRSRAARPAAGYSRTFSNVAASIQFAR
jgi:hypothetical protein